MLEEEEILVCALSMLSSTQLRGLRLSVARRLAQLYRQRLMRTRHYVTARCLSLTCESAWATFYVNASDVNFLNATSLTRFAFDELCHAFRAFYHISEPSRVGGRPPKLRRHHEVLGLVLSFYVGSMGQADLCRLFGVPPSTLSRMLAKAEKALGETLARCHAARIMWPSLRRQKEMAELVEAREPLLKFTFGFIDGKNYKVQQPSASDVQNAMYNGWLHAVLVTGTICFGADGCILWFKHTCPGSCNDSVTSVEFRENMLNPSMCPDPRYGVVADSAFPSSAQMVGRTLTPLKTCAIDRILLSRRHAALALHNAIVSVRQAAEWGVGSIEKVYHRLAIPLPYDPVRRGLRLSNLFHLSNYRVRSVGISQIRNTFRGDMNP